MEKTVKKRKGTGGFTLVELIVVIAILAILAGVGTVAYTGYITATRKGVDRQTVGDLMYAAQLADYANPNLFGNDGSAMIAVTEQGTLVAGGSDLTLLESAMEDSVGDLDNVSLSYDDWNGTVDGATFQGMKDSLSGIGYTDESGNILWTDAEGNTASVSYAASADELWNTVETVAQGLADSNSLGGMSAGEYLARAAQYTAETDTINSGTLMGNAFATTGRITEIISGATETTDPVASGAGLAAVMARNYAFAEYVRNQTDVSTATIAAIQNYFPDDIISLLYNNSNPSNITGLNDNIRTDFSALKSAVDGYLDPCFSDGTSNVSQAYLDGMIYYALMYNINDVSGEDGIYDPSDSGYLDDISGYVSVAGTAFSGAVDWDSMVALADSLGNGSYNCTVVITATKENGHLTFKVSPADADPRDGEESSGSVNCTESHSETLTVQRRGSTDTALVQFFVDGTSANSTLILCSIDSNYSQIAITYGANAQVGDFTFTPTDSSIISVDGNTVTALRAGTTTLTVTHSGGKEAQITVVVH